MFVGSSPRKEQTSVTSSCQLFYLGYDLTHCHGVKAEEEEEEGRGGEGWYSQRAIKMDHNNNSPHPKTPGRRISRLHGGTNEGN